MNVFFLSITGLAAGGAHVLSGPDHLAAIVPMAVNQRRNTWRLGLFWGLGHSGGVWAIALLGLLFREALPIDLMSTWGERLVGFILIGIGLIGFRRLYGTLIHSHEHEHDGTQHIHIHVHDHKPNHDHPKEHSHTHGALGIGILHGLAGTSHLLGVLPALLLPSRLAAVTYVIAYGVGSILAMTAFSWIMGVVAHRLQALGNRTYRYLLGGCCMLTILIGCYWCYMTLSPDALPS